MTHTERQEKALRAATAVAERFGLMPTAPVILKDSNHTSIHLAPFPIVARVCTGVWGPDVASRLARELAVAQHLVQAGAPIVPPSLDPPPGPYWYADTGLTLWQFVAHLPARESDGRKAAEALHIVHDALANYAGTLPSFAVAMESCRALLDDASTLRALAPADRGFLIAEYDRLRALLAAFPFVPAPLHGDPHLGNVLLTSSGPRWTDFESACVGPREWDLTCLPEVSLTAFRTVDHELLAVLRDLRSMCVAVWCWVGPDRASEKREAAEFHLRRLQERADAARTI
jgi:hypothetical protein